MVNFGFFFFLALLEPMSTCMDDQRRELEFPGFYFFYGERLINHVIRTIKALDQDSCELQCYMEHNCVSINFDFTGTHNCDLNNATHKEHEKDLVKTKGYVYHGTKNVCVEAPCQNNGTCQTGFTSKGYRCLCNQGFTGGNCELDVDECEDDPKICDQNAFCNNTKGSYQCTCNTGYTGNGHSCTDADECSASESLCDVNADCENTRSSYRCLCKPGFSGDGRTCNDIDECSTNSDSCDANAVCSNTDGSHSCSCKAGFVGDGKYCSDIDECAIKTDNCSIHAVCNNTEGSFNCSCKDGFSGNGVICTVSCQIAPLGVESRLIPDAQLTASSQYDENHSAQRARLKMEKEGSKRGGWVPRFQNLNQWLQVDLGNVSIVTAVATQGRSDYPQYVKKYKLLYSQDGSHFLYYRETGQPEDKEFSGNSDQKTIVKHEITTPPITARFIRFQPLASHIGIGMRVELYGCRLS